MLRLFVVQIESHPFITIGARDLSREPFLSRDAAGTIMERLSKTMDTAGVALECGERYRRWHDSRHAAIEKWIKAAILKNESRTKCENIIVFPEGSIGRHQLKGLSAFAKDLSESGHRVTIIGGSHSFEFNHATLRDYPEEIYHFDDDPYNKREKSKARTSSYGESLASGPTSTEDSRAVGYDREGELRRIANDTNFDIKQIVPIIHSDGSISMRIKQYLSPFERTNTSQLSRTRKRVDGKLPKIKSFRLSKDVPSPRVLPLVCSEALQYLKGLDAASLLCIVSNHARAGEFKHLMEQAVKNAIPAVLANDGAFGGSGVSIIHDNRAENWWFAGANHGGLPSGDAILVVELDLKYSTPQLARANPRFPTGLAGLAAIVPANAADPNCYISNELVKLKHYVDDAFLDSSSLGIDYKLLCDHLETLIHSKKASPTQTVKLRRLLALALARNLDQKSVETLCDDCQFGE